MVSNIDISTWSLRYALEEDLKIPLDDVPVSPEVRRQIATAIATVAVDYNLDLDKPVSQYSDLERNNFQFLWEQILPALINAALSPD